MQVRFLSPAPMGDVGCPDWDRAALFVGRAQGAGLAQAHRLAPAHPRSRRAPASSLPLRLVLGRHSRALLPRKPVPGLHQHALLPRKPDPGQRPRAYGYPRYATRQTQRLATATNKGASVPFASRRVPCRVRMGADVPFASRRVPSSLQTAHRGSLAASQVPSWAQTAQESGKTCRDTHRQPQRQTRNARSPLIRPVRPTDTTTALRLARTKRPGTRMGCPAQTSSLVASRKATPGKTYTMPCAIMASATFLKPAMLAPTTRLPSWPYSAAVSAQLW